MSRGLPRLVGVERGAGEPLYRQVRRAVEHGIVTGEFSFDTPLPSSRDLARQLGLSRNTVNTAYQELSAEGFIVARPRSGFYVNEEMRLHDPVLARSNPDITAGVRWKERLRQPPDVQLPEIEKIRDWQHYPYPFIAGQVASSTFPRLAWAAALREALRSPHLHYSLRDGISADDPLLVDMLCRHILPGRGIEAGADEVLITMGSQQGLRLISETLLSPGSVVGVENPGYLDAWHIFVRAGANVGPIPVDRSGLIPPASLREMDLIYTTPSHHHPTNVTLAIGRRRQLLLLAETDDSLVVEDDYDSELRYQGSPSPALKALDRTGRVVYIGTFSKFLAPGLRLGYVVGHRELISHLRSERRYSIRHPPGHVQRAMALLIEHGQYHRAVRRHRASLQRKWEAMSEALNKHFPWPTAPPPGGVSIWMTGPEGFNGGDLVAHAQRRGIILERGDIFFLAQAAGRNHFRLGFAAIDLTAIEPGIRTLANVAETQIKGLRNET